MTHINGGNGVFDADSYVNVQEGVKRLVNNAQLYKKLLLSFKGQKIVDELTAHITKKEYADIARVAHALKGSALNLSLPKLAAAASEVEQQAKLNLTDDAYAEQLNAVLADTVKAIQILIENGKL